MNNAKPFLWHRKWVEFSDTLPEQEQLPFYEAVARYGLKGEEPKGLCVEAMEYFNAKVRPELDRQHKRMGRKGYGL